MLPMRKQVVMKESLQRKVDLLDQNTQTVRKSAKLDFSAAANLAALLFTSENLVAEEGAIRANRALLKEHVGAFSNMRGSAANLALIARMCIKPDPEAYLEKVMQAYKTISSSRKLASESLVLAAMAMVEDTDPSEYETAARAAWSNLEQMRETHPLITGQSDFTLCHLIGKSGFDSKQLLENAEVIYQKLKPTGFKLNKDALQSISIILALGDKPIDEKCAKFDEIRTKLVENNHGVFGDELAVLAAFANSDLSVDEAVAEIIEVDNELKHVHGYGALACGANLRRLYASTLVLQAYGEEMRTANAATNTAVATQITETVIFAVIMMIITMIVVTSCMAATTASS